MKTCTTNSVNTSRPMRTFTKLLMGFFMFLVMGGVSWGQGSKSYSTAGTYTFIVPPGVTSVNITASGAGGGGANGIATSGGGGGGGGAYKGVTGVSVSPGSSITIVVGAGGGPGVAGGLSSTSVSALSVNGGAAGTVPAGGAGATVSFGTSGGAGGNGFPNGGGGGGGGAASPSIGGTSGGNGTISNGGGGGAFNGGGGGSPMNNGTTGVQPGGGGGGGGFGATPGIGGNGGDGQVDITWTCPSYSITGTYGPYCSSNNSAISLTGTPSAVVGVGPTFSGPGVTSSGTGGAATFNPSIAGAGTHTITYSYALPDGCTTSATKTITVNPTPVINNFTPSVCTGVPFTVTPSNGTDGVVPAGTTYSWPTPAVTGGLTGGASGSGSSISGTLTNSTSTAQTATYTVTPTAGPCTGSTFTVTVTVKAESTAASTATTSADNFCPGTSTNLGITGGSLGTGAAWKWYSGGCGISGGGTLVGTGATITVSPTVTTTYFVRAEGDCNTTTCASVTVTVKTESVAASTATTSNNNFCIGGSTTLGITGGSLGTGAVWKWYSGSCGGTPVGTGASIMVSPTTTTTYFVRAEGDCNITTCASVTVTVTGPVYNVTQNTYFCTIQAANDYASTANGDIITVAAGTYPEQVNVTKRLDIRGANYGTAGSGSRVAESIIVPPSELNLAASPRESSATPLITLAVDGIKMDGFRISGDNPLINGYAYAGLNVEAGRGIKSTGNTIVFQNNIVEKFTYIGFNSEGGLSSPHYKDILVTNNKFDNIQDVNQLGFGFAMYLSGSAGAVTSNVVTNSRVAIQVQPYQVVQGTNGVSVCSNNNFSVWRQGIYYNYAEVGASAWTINANTITACQPPVNPTGPVLWEGMRAETMRANGNGGTLSNNIINGTGAVADNVKWWGVWGMNYRGGASTSTQVFFTGNTVSNVELGMVHSAAADIVLTGNNLSASNKAISVQREYNSAGVIQATGGINNIDATGGNTINGVASGSATLAQLFTIEDAINHKIDNSTFGFVTVRANNTYVTVNSFAAPNAVAAIQRGIDAASNGFIVNVDAGTFNEPAQLLVNKNVTVRGAGNTTIVKPTVNTTFGGNVPSESFIYIDPATIATLEKFTVDGAGKQIHHAIQSRGGLTADNLIIQNIKYGQYLGRGIVFYSGASNLVSNTTFTNIERIGIHVRGGVATPLPVVNIQNISYTGKGTGDYLDYGVEIGGGGNATIQNSTITNNKGVALSDGSTSAGILATTFFGPGTTGLITNNFITGNTEGIIVGFDGSDASSVTANFNDLSGNTSYAIRSLVATVPATCNWYGSASAAAVAAKISGPVTYIPYLVNGTDNLPDPGFQPVSGSCTGSPILITSAVASPQTCAGNGSIVVTFSGGTNPYSYTLNGGSPVIISGPPFSPFTISGLPANTYTIVITDVNGSTATTNATITYNPVTNTTANPDKYYTSIQAAINDAATGDVIEVCAGTYAENIIVNKSVTINGPNAGIAPCSSTPRVAEAIVVPATAAISSGEIFHVAASNVTISGFTINGDNTALTSGFTSTTTADIDAAEGITVYEDNINNLTATNNIIKNLSYFGITMNGGYDLTPTYTDHGIPSTGHNISNNSFKDLGTYDFGSGIDRWGGAVLLYNNQYASVTNNCMDNVRLGVQTGNYYQANPGGNTAFQLINGNTMTNVRRLGVFHNLAYSNASPYTVSNNTITGVSNVNETRWDGVELFSLSVPSTASGNVVNATVVSQLSSGIQVWNVKSTTPTAISGGSVTGTTNGVFVNNFDGFNSDASPDGAHATLGTITLTNNTTGIRVKDNAASTHAPVVLAINAGVTVTGGTNGLVIQNNSASVTSLSDIAFSGQTGPYIDLQSNANNIDATTATFGGLTGGAATNPQNWTIEDKINHKIDLGTLGFVTVKANNTFVTPNSFVAPNTEAKIQRGVDAASDGFTENIQTGTYRDNVVVNKDITVTGESRTGVIVIPAVGSPLPVGSLTNPVFLVKTNGVTINALTVDGKNSTLNGASDIDASTGIITDWATGDFTGLEVFNVEVKDVFLRGLQASNNASASNTFNFHDNTISGVNSDASSIAVFNYGDAGQITNNTINNSNAGIQTNYSIGTTISGNTVTGIAGGTGIESDNSGGAGGIADVISGNTVNAGAYGIFVFHPALTVGVNANSVTNYATAGVTVAGRDGTGSASITANEINGNNQAGATGILITSADQGFGTMDAAATATNNYVINNGMDGFKLVTISGKTVTLSATDNSITGNGNKNAEVTGDGTANATMTCNWWGTNVAADVAAKIAGTITYIPYRSDGTEVDPAIGFQPTSACSAPCTGTVTATVTQTTSVCAAGPNTGTLTVTGTTGGTAPYTYTISGPTVNTTGASSGTFTGLSQGTYTITVYQATGCSTALAPILVKDIIAPTFDICPAAVTGQPVTMSGCRASVDPPDPVATDNCTPPAVTYVLTGATTGSGTAPIGAMNFNAGTTIITYTATDQSNNTATCSTSVTVVNNLKDSIGGTATVVQNNSTTSNITFYANGGTGPYTFTYNVNGGPNQMVTTNSGNNIVTVPQSNAVVGQYIYTLVSGTDAFGCNAAIASDFRDTITVTATSTRPDFVSSVPEPLSATFVNGQSKEGYVEINNVSTVPSTGQITFRIANVANFTFSFPPNMMTIAGAFGTETVNNSDWTITPGDFFYTVTSKPGRVINGGAFSRVGFVITATGNAGSQGIMTVTILNDTGGSSVGAGDSNSNNNQSVTLFSIN